MDLGEKVEFCAELKSFRYEREAVQEFRDTRGITGETRLQQGDVELADLREFVRTNQEKRITRILFDENKTGMVIGKTTIEEDVFDRTTAYAGESIPRFYAIRMSLRGRVYKVAESDVFPVRETT